MALTKVKAGNIILTTPSASSNDVTPATTQYVTTALANLADSAPSTLNTLNELAAALGDDANFSTTVTNSIATKLPLAGGTMTGNLAITTGDAKITLTDNTSSTRAWSISVGGSADNAFEIKDVTGSNTLLKSTPGLKTVIRPDGNEFHLDTSTGNFFKTYESGGALYIQNTIADGDINIGGKIGSTQTEFLLFDNSAGGRANFGNDIGLNDDRAIRFGAGDDMALFHDGGNSYIRNTTGWLNIPVSQNGVTIANSNFSKIIAKFLLNGANELYYDGSKKLETTSGGFRSSGSFTTESTTPLQFIANGSENTYMKNVIYANQNNTSSNFNNGIHIEMGRISDSSSAEQRAFVIGARGGQSSFKVLAQEAGITQTDGDYLVRMWEHNADGFISLYTGEGAPVERSRITSYGQSWVRGLGIGDGDSARTPPTGALLTMDSCGDNTPLISMIQSNARLASIQVNFSTQANSYIALAPPSGATNKTAQKVFHFHGDGKIKITNTSGTTREFLETHVGNNGTTAGFALGGVSASASSGTGNIHSIHFLQSGKITWGDWVDTSALGICEGSWNQEGTDRDLLSIHHRNSINWYGNSNGQTLSMATGGGMSIKGSLTQNQFSDMRLKRDIVPLESILDKVNSLDVFNFNYMDPDTGEVDEERNRDTGQIGLSAQQTEELFPQVVQDRERIEGDNTVDNRSWKYLEYEKMTPILIKAVQELKAELEETKARIASLEG